MTAEVDHRNRQLAWPIDQFHPVYESFLEWLDSEAPTEPARPRWTGRKVQRR